MPSATAREFQRVARQLDGRAVTIPLHGGREIGPPLFFKILRQCGIALDEFQRLR